jgi:hypothetical protein
MELAQGGLFLRTMGYAVDHSPTHAADAFTAVVIESDWLKSFESEPFIQHVDHFQERTVGADILESMFLKSAFRQGAVLSPNFHINIYRFR